jgi:hypothetical protein
MPRRLSLLGLGGFRIFAPDYLIRFAGNVSISVLGAI